MDSTTNNSNPPQQGQPGFSQPIQPVQQVSPQQQPVPPAGSPVQQQPPLQQEVYQPQQIYSNQQFSSQSMPASQPQAVPQPSANPVWQSAPLPLQQPTGVQQPNSGPLPTEQTTTSSPRITLEDLYGPSGFADASSPLQPLTTQPAAEVPVPPVVPTAPPVTPSPLAIPDLPSLSQPSPVIPVQQEEGVSAPEQPVTPSMPALPLRKGVFQESGGMQSPPPPIPPVPPSTPGSPSDTKDASSGGLNKLKVLRFLFGGLAVLIFMVVILFVVQYLSVVFHPSGSSSKVTLVYWGLWEDNNTMQSIISEFESQHPNITIDYEKQDPKQYSQRLLTRIQQGNGPDIFRYHSSWLPMLQPVLAPLSTSVMSKQELQTNFYPVVRADLVRNGALYGIPLEVDTLSLFVNNTIFKNAKAQVPTTWDDFTSTARALTVKDANGKIKTAGAALGTYDNITHASDIVSALLVQNGVDLKTMTPASNASDALTFYTSFATGDSNVWDNTLDPSMLAFARGNLAMYFGYSWDVFLIKASNPNLDFSIYSIPHLPGRNTTTASYWVEGVSAKSSHQKEALEFMRFLAQKSTEATLYTEESKTRLFGEPYARTDLGETLKNNPLVYPFVLQANDAASSFFAGETDDSALNGQMNGYLGNAIRSVLNGTSAQSAVDTLTKGVQQVEKQYGF